MAIRPDLRVGDADRERAASALREHYVAGRLNQEEFQERLDATFAAKTERDLTVIAQDLPGGLTTAPPPAATSRAHRGGAGHGESRAVDHGQSTQRQARRPRRALLGTLGAALASWLILTSVVLVWLPGFPVPGRIAIFVAIFALIRRLFRRIARGPGIPRRPF